MKLIHTKWLSVIVIFILMGCTQRLLDFTIISTKNIDFTKASEFVRNNQRTDGKDDVFIFIFIPLGIPNWKDAVDRAIDKVPGAIALEDGVLRSQGFWLIFGYAAIIAEGTPLIDKKLIKGELPSNYMISYYDKNMEQKLVYVSKDDMLHIRSAIANKDNEVIENIILRN